MDLQDLKQKLVAGNASAVKKLVQAALDAGYPAAGILKQALVPGR